MEGFGLQVSAQKVKSSISDLKVDQNSGLVIAGAKGPINGLSGISNHVTVYYENHGFSARRQPALSFSPLPRRRVTSLFRPTTRSARCGQGGGHRDLAMPSTRRGAGLQGLVAVVAGQQPYG